MQDDSAELGGANHSTAGLSEGIRVLAVDRSEDTLSLYREAVGERSAETGVDLRATLDCGRSPADAVKAVREAVRLRAPYAVIFLEFDRRADGGGAVRTAGRIRAQDPHANFVFAVAEDHAEVGPRPEEVPPADKLLVVHKPIHLREIRQFVSALGMKWLSERLLHRANRELEQKVQQLHESRESLLAHQRQLQEVNQRLMETNNALSVLARNLEKARRESEARMLRRSMRLLVPVLDRMQADPRLRHRQTDLDQLRVYIRDLTRETATEARVAAVLSPAELRVALLVQKGLTTDEAARHLNVSPMTVKTHRKNIRRKLELRNRPVNLQTYLQSEIPDLG